MKSKESAQKVKEKILKEYPRMKPEDKFKFGCHPGVECFNKCCNDVNIFLTPYDIIRLKNRLGISSAEFLEKYTLIPLEENLKHPIVMLRMRDDNLNCHFVDSEKGCSVYEDRPWSCRMFPVGVASPQEDEDSLDEEFYFLLREDVCKGFDHGKEWTIQEWMDDQGVSEYAEVGQLFKELSLHKGFHSTSGLQPVKLEMFYTVCYNLDKFRDLVFNSTFLKRFDIEPEMQEKMKKDDVELLKYGFNFLRFSLFGEKTVAIKEDYAKSIKGK